MVIENPLGQADDQRLAQRQLDQLDALMEIGPERLKVSISIGIARRQNERVTAGLLVRQAEIALYDARAKGGDQARLYDTDMDDLLQARARIAEDLAAAIEMREHLSMVYQPIFALEMPELLGAEALLRWNHPIHGRLDTRLLIEIAEERGLMAQLGDWTLETVLAHLAHSPLPWVALNVSPDHLKSENFIERLRLRLAASEVYPARLHLELPLSVFLDPSLSDTLDAIAALGVELMLDGLEKAEDLARSALWQNATLATIRTIKLASRVTRGLGADLSGEAALWSVIRHARLRSIAIAAKDVETEAQSDLLVRFGVTQVQGYWYAPPTTASTIDTLAQRRLSA